MIVAVIPHGMGLGEGDFKWKETELLIFSLFFWFFAFFAIQTGWQMWRYEGDYVAGIVVAFLGAAPAVLIYDQTLLEVRIALGM